MKKMTSILMLSLISAHVFAAESAHVIAFSQGSAAAQKEAWTKLIASEKPTVVKFSATWCGPCKATVVPFSDMATKYKDKATFVVVDADKNSSICDLCGVRGLPTFAIYHKGKLVGTTMTGSGKLSKVEAELNTLLTSKK